MNFKKMVTQSIILTLTSCSLIQHVDAKKRKTKKKDPIHVVHDIRGLSASKLLYGIANTCNQVSNVVTAETQKEKQQAVFGVLGSLFMLAGDIAGEEAKRSAQNNPQGAHQQTRTTESAPSLQLNTRRSVSSIDLPLIKELTGIKNKNKQAEHIKTMLKYEPTASLLVSELCLILDFLTIPQEQSLVKTVKSILSETLTPRS